MPHFQSGFPPLPSACFVLPSAFVLAPAPRVPTAISRRYTRGSPVWSPCASGNSLRLRHLQMSALRKSLRLRHFSYHHCYFTLSSSCLGCAFLANKILLSGQPTRLVQARTAPPLRSLSPAGILLLVCEREAVLACSGAKTRPPAPLPQRARVFGLHPEAPTLLAAPQHIPHIVAAPATLDNRVKASSCGRAVWATAAPASLGGALTGWSHIPRFFDCVAGPAPRGDAESAPLLSAGPGAR